MRYLAFIAKNILRGFRQGLFGIFAVFLVVGDNTIAIRVIGLAICFHEMSKRHYIIYSFYVLIWVGIKPTAIEQKMNSGGFYNHLFRFFRRFILIIQYKKTFT